MTFKFIEMHLYFATQQSLGNKFLPCPVIATRVQCASMLLALLCEAKALPAYSCGGMLIYEHRIHLTIL